MLEELPKEKRIPTLVLSARGEEVDKLRGFELGIDDYLTKPFSPKELIAVLKLFITALIKIYPIYINSILSNLIFPHIH